MEIFLVLEKPERKIFLIGSADNNRMEIEKQIIKHFDFQIIHYTVPMIMEITSNQMRDIEIERLSFEKTILIDIANDIILPSIRSKHADYNYRQRFDSHRIKGVNITPKKVLYKKASRGNKK